MFFSLWRTRVKQPSKIKATARPRRFRPRIEALEERWLPSTLNFWRPGMGSTDMWNTASNWSLGHVPGSTEIATFDGTNTAPSVIDAGPDTVFGINITSGYTSAVFLTAANLILGAGGFAQAGGSFEAGSGTILDNGNWSESSSTGFTPFTSTVIFGAANVTQTVDPGFSAFNNVSHTGSSFMQLTNHFLTVNGSFINSGGTLDVNGQNLVVSGLSTITDSSVTNSVNGAGEVITLAGGLTMTGGTLNSGTGRILLSGGVSVTKDMTAFGFLSQFFGNLDLNGATQTFSIPVVNTELDVQAVVSNGGITETGQGIMFLIASNTYSGPTTVNAGNLAVTGSLPNSPVTINSGGVLSGNGTVGAVTVNNGGVLFPGHFSGSLNGIITTGNLQFNSGGNFAVSVNGLVPGGFGYGQLRVNGTVNLGAGVATLSTFGSLKPHSGDRFTLIDNPGGMPISGFFANLPEGAIVNDQTLGRILITYKGGLSGHDMVVTSVPLVDIVGRVSSTGQWWVGTSNGSGFSNSLFTTWNPNVSWVDVHTGDFNGDGHQDIVGRDLATGDWWVAQSNGSNGFTNSLWGNWNPAATWVDVQVGDFNGDGKTDIVGRFAQAGQWWMAQSTGSSFTNQLWATWNPNVTWVDVKVGDFNGDGMADIAGRFLQAGQWWVGVSNGSSFSTSLWTTWNPAVTWVDVNVGDFNGDGKSDITGRFLQTGQWWVGLSTGTSFNTTLWATWSPNVTWVDVKVGDFNGDGMADITGRVAQNGQWWTAVSTGSSFTNSLWATWNPNVTWVDVQVGDFNGDGKSDITGRVAQDGSWWTGVSTGSSFTTTQWGKWNPAVTWGDVQAGNYS
jgi:autotransporter-associated beta strand protein